MVSRPSHNRTYVGSIPAYGKNELVSDTNSKTEHHLCAHGSRVFYNIFFLGRSLFGGWALKNFEMTLLA